MEPLGCHCKCSFVSIYTSIAFYKVAIILGLCHSDNSLPRRNQGIPMKQKIPLTWDGADDENRTHVTALRRQRNATIRHQLMRFQLKVYSVLISPQTMTDLWSCRWGSNPRPPLYQSGILPLNYYSLWSWRRESNPVHRVTRAI